MTIYTSTQLQSSIGKVLSDVSALGWVKIKNRSRPDMILITQEAFDEMLLAGKQSNNDPSPTENK